MVFHLLVTTAIALVAVGASGLSKTTLSPAQITSNQSLVKADMVMLLLEWGFITALTFLASQQAYAKATRKLANDRGGKTLLLAMAISIPFLGIRVLERFIYFFTQNPYLSLVSGSLGLKVGLEVVEEIVVSSSLIIAGVLTRNIQEM